MNNINNNIGGLLFCCLFFVIFFSVRLLIGPIKNLYMRDLLLQLDPYKHMRPDRIHPRTLQELADVITK